MKHIIVGMENCPKCKMLKEQHPEVDYIEFKGDEMLTLLAFARTMDIKSLPFLVTIGEIDELNKVAQNG